MEFSDRFKISNSAFSEEVLTDLLDDEVEAVSKELASMLLMVKRHSVLLRSKTVEEVYYAITEHADPRIALVLAAGRDEAGRQLFPSWEVVKHSMFGVSYQGATTPYYQRDVFISGIRRVSASLAASVLIAQLAQIPEQKQHAELIERQALDDLDRILKVPNILESGYVDNKEEDKKGFYFQAKEFGVKNATLVAKVFMSSQTYRGWVVFGEYVGKVSTANIVVDLADYINRVTLESNAQSGNVLASPVLAADMNAGGDIHAVEFDARTKDAVIHTEVISVQFELGAETKMPFLWGVKSSLLKTYTVNSALVKVHNGRITLSTLHQDIDKQPPTVIYFRRRLLTEGKLLDDSGDEITAGRLVDNKFTYRISPTMTENKVVKVPYLTNSDGDIQAYLDTDRPSQVATILLNGLFEVKGEVKALGAIVRNDPKTIPNPITGLELVGYSATDPEVHLILDVLTLPLDIEVAIGNLLGPLTAFSHKPRSIKARTHYDTNQPMRGVDRVNDEAKLVKLPPSELLGVFRDIRETEKDYSAYRHLDYTKYKYPIL